MATRRMEKGDIVRFKTQVDGFIKEVEGTIKSFIPISEARRRGLIPKEGRRRSGTILEIDAEIDKGRRRLVYKHRSLVKQVSTHKQL